MSEGTTNGPTLETSDKEPVTQPSTMDKVMASLQDKLTAMESASIRILPCILARPEKPGVYEKFGRLSTQAVDIKYPIRLPNGVTIQVPCSLWGRLGNGPNGVKTVFDLSFGKGIGVDDSDKMLANSIKAEIAAWDGWALAAQEAHRRLTTPRKEVKNVDLDYEVPLKPGVEGYRAPVNRGKR